MRENRKRYKTILSGLLLAAAVSGGSLLGVGMSAEASYEKIDSPDFEVEASLLASDENTYNIQVAVENKGKDWEGTVRLFVSENYYVPSAYDTAISLPQGTEKQFVVKVPKGSSESVDGAVRVVLLDKKSKVIEEENFKKLLTMEMECITMGILSDEYSSLTYLDMGGDSLYYYGSNLPIMLAELTQDNLSVMLDSLTILVIDRYDTSVLTEEQAKAISLWVDNGGVLLAGTGSSVKETLAGLGDVLPNVSYMGVTEADSSGNAEGNYGEYPISFSMLDMAQLDVNSNQYMECYFSGGYALSQGDGAVAVLPYSLVDLSKAGEAVYAGDTQENYLRNMLEEMTSCSSARYNKTNSSGNMYDKMSAIRRLLGMLGNCNSSFSFGALKFLVIAYVIFVGPILYLILRLAKKREWYWIAVPVSALLGIVMVFFAGRGFEVVDTRVYSVTARNLSDNGGETSYLYCYDADFREWDLQLNDDYDYAGALMNDNYDYMSSDQKVYYHHIKKEGDALSFGIKPTSSFEDSYFYGGKDKSQISPMGSIQIEAVGSHWANVDFQITNDTDKNFLYYAVVVNDTLYVYKDLSAGETVVLKGEVPLYASGQGYSLRSEYIYDFLRDEHRDKKSKEDIAALSALGVGLAEARPVSNPGVVVVCGVTEDWNETVNDNCKEISYGCLYVVQ